MIFTSIIIVFLLYSTLIFGLIIGFDRVPISFLDNSNKHKFQKFTIIIPFRNEAKNISILANSLLQLDYPVTHFEIIWINDQSTDNSVPLLTEFIVKKSNWKLIDTIRKSNSPKKDAITAAIYKANNTWILTTDADCIVPKNWLQSFNQFISTQSSKVKMIAAPVAYTTNNSFLQQFQNIDFLSLIGTTIGAFGIQKPFMCNGANLCYSKQVFFEVHGFDGNDSVSSGDDVFLLEKVHNKYPKELFYLKNRDAFVYTKPVDTYKKLINQRIRWASKTSSTKNIFSKLVGTLVLLMNIASIFLLFVGLYSLFFDVTMLGISLLVIYILKIGVDYILIKKTMSFLKQALNVKMFFKSALFYPFFVVFIFFNTFTKKTVWKGRKVISH